MEIDHITNHPTSWICGQFDHALLHTHFEVGFKQYTAGQTDTPHYHKHCNEITIITSGIAQMIIRDIENKMHNITLKTGDIVLIEPYEVGMFMAVTDCMLISIKDRPSVGDKFETGEFSYESL